MHRSNPLGWAAGALLFGAFALAWYALHGFPAASRISFAIGYCAIASAVGLWMWQHGQRRARLIEDIPTSKIASAPQGYVELLGRAVELEEISLVTGLSGTACLWFRCQIAERGGGVRSSHDFVTGILANFFYWPTGQEESQSCFGIDDGTGCAVVFPYSAEVVTRHRRVWYQGDVRYTEDRIMPGDTLYVLGDFSTHDPGQASFDLMNEVSAQISIWRADQATLLRRFDQNRNGVLDAAEWEAMHAEALRLAKAREAQLQAQPVVHRVMAPDPGFQYLVSSRPPAELAGHYRFWRAFGLALFFGAGSVGIWLFGVFLAR
jgi:hypothetical protein